jgi:TetR/AcrR family transcriptional repressor of nem operon
MVSGQGGDVASFLVDDQSIVNAMAGTSSTREHLLEVGLRRLRSHGYTATGVKDVLDLAGVPKGSFYHYFPSKEAFVGELLQRYFADEAERAVRLLGDTAIPPLTRLRSYFDELFAFFGSASEISGCLMGGLSLEMADHSETLQVQLKAMFDGWQAGIAGVLRQAIEGGELRQGTDPDEMAAFLINSYEGALMRMKADKSDRPLETFRHFTFDVLLTR